MLMSRDLPEQASLKYQLKQMITLKQEAFEAPSLYLRLPLSSPVLLQIELNTPNEFLPFFMFISYIFLTHLFHFLHFEAMPEAIARRYLGAKSGVNTHNLLFQASTHVFSRCLMNWLDYKSMLTGAQLSLIHAWAKL